VHDLAALELDRIARHTVVYALGTKCVTANLRASRHGVTRAFHRRKGRLKVLGDVLFKRAPHGGLPDARGITRPIFPHCVRREELHQSFEIAAVTSVDGLPKDRYRVGLCKGGGNATGHGEEHEQASANAVAKMPAYLADADTPAGKPSGKALLARRGTPVNRWASMSTRYESCAREYRGRALPSRADIGFAG